MAENRDSAYYANKFFIVQDNYGALNNLTIYGQAEAGPGPLAEPDIILKVISTEGKKYKFDCSVVSFDDYYEKLRQASRVHCIGVGEGIHDICHIQANLSMAGIGLRLNEKFKDPKTGDLYGQDDLLKNLFVTSRTKKVVGPALQKYASTAPFPPADDVDGNSITYNVKMNVTRDFAAMVKLGEGGEHLFDFVEAYNQIYPAFVLAARDIAPQATENKLWKALYNKLRDSPLKGGVPDEKKDYTSDNNKTPAVAKSTKQYENPMPWIRQLATLYDQVSELSKARDKNDGEHHVEGYTIFWAADEPQKYEYALIDGTKKQIDVPPHTIIYQVDDWVSKRDPKRVRTPSQIINPQEMMKVDCAGRTLPPL